MIRDCAGRLQAIHVRRDTSDGKDMSWRGPAGSYGLGGRRVDSLPLYGSERVTDWPLDAWIIVCEGENDTDALLALNVPALGTVTGAASCPTPDALADVAPGRRFVVWPDNDDAGRAHMAAMAASLYRAGAAAVRSLQYRPVAGPWPIGAGARDLFGQSDPAAGAYLAAWLVEEWSLPVGRPGPLVTVETSRRREVLSPRDTGSVSDALAALGVKNARPGRTVRCPAHSDRSASLSILRDDRRAICRSASCLFAGPLTPAGRPRGVWAADIIALVPA